MNLKYKYLIICLCLININYSQISEANNNLKTAFNNYSLAFDNINNGVYSMNNCYNIKNASTLRTQILYACSDPSNARQNIDNAIKNVTLAILQLESISCPLAIMYLKNSKRKFNAANDNLKLGFLAFMSASEQRKISNIRYKLNIGLPHWKSSITQLNAAIIEIKNAVSEINKCTNVEDIQTKFGNHNCLTVIEEVKKNGKFKEILVEFQLKSSWLKKIQLYNYNNYLMVIASIEVNNNSSELKEYIYCDIPKKDWDLFFSKTSSISYSKRFHQYIIDNKCGCE